MTTFSIGIDTGGAYTDAVIVDTHSHELTDRPVTASTELSDGLNGPLRALTATFNVRIVSLIIDLLNSVRISMHEHNIDAPLMILKGNGHRRMP